MSSANTKLEVQLIKGESNLMWYYAISIPQDIAEQFISEKDKRVICTLPKGTRFHCALLPMKGAGHYILINKARRDKEGLRAGEVFEISLEKDTSEYGAPMSDEFAAVLEQDELANKLFHALTPGKQRTLIYYSDNVKSSDIKIRRALVVMEHLVEMNGDLDYKILGAAIKKANQEANRK